MARGGVLILDQTVRIEGDKPKTRRWQLRPAREGWSGTLTDAKGQVVASRDGGSLARVRAAANAKGGALQRVRTFSEANVFADARGARASELRRGPKMDRITSAKSGKTTIRAASFMTKP